MKKIRSKLAMILMMMLIFTSLEFVGVFAEGEDGDAPAAAPAATEETTDAEVEEEAPVVTEEEAVEPEGGVDEAAPEAEEEAPAITNQESTYSITYTAAEGGEVLPEGLQNYDAASDIAGSTATPKDGYKFTGWYYGGTQASTDATLTKDVILQKLGTETSGAFEARFEEVKVEIQDLQALSSYKCVHLRWKNPVPLDDVSYMITYNGKTYTDPAIKDFGNGWYEYVAMGLSADINCRTGKYPSYYFTVRAERKSKPGEAVAAGKSGSPVRTIAYKIKIKSSSTLTSHYGPDGKQNSSKKFTVKKGEYIYAYGYGFGGKYVFKDPRGYVFFCNLTRTSNRSCVYEKSKNYDEREAKLFVNDSGVSSSKGNSLVWVNTYTQHIYLFKGSKGNWVLNGVNDECSTGKASSPSPTVQNGMKSVEGYIKKRHGIPYWTKYSGINAIHAKKAKWKMGKPASNGCVRNYEKNAKRIFENTRKGSRVYLY